MPIEKAFLNAAVNGKKTFRPEPTKTKTGFAATLKQLVAQKIAAQPQMQGRMPENGFQGDRDPTRSPAPDQPVNERRHDRDDRSVADRPNDWRQSERQNHDSESAAHRQVSERDSRDQNQEREESSAGNSVRQVDDKSENKNDDQAKLEAKQAQNSDSSSSAEAQKETTSSVSEKDSATTLTPTEAAKPKLVPTEGETTVAPVISVPLSGDDPAGPTSVTITDTTVSLTGTSETDDKKPTGTAGQSQAPVSETVAAPIQPKPADASNLISKVDPALPSATDASASLNRPVVSDSDVPVQAVMAKNIEPAIKTTSDPTLNGQSTSPNREQNPDIKIQPSGENQGRARGDGPKPTPLLHQPSQTAGEAEKANLIAASALTSRAESRSVATASSVSATSSTAGSESPAQAGMVLSLSARNTGQAESEIGGAIKTAETSKPVTSSTSMAESTAKLAETEGSGQAKSVRGSTVADKSSTPISGSDSDKQIHQGATNEGKVGRPLAPEGRVATDSAKEVFTLQRTPVESPTSARNAEPMTFQTSDRSLSTPINPGLAEQQRLAQAVAARTGNSKTPDVLLRLDPRAQAADRSAPPIAMVQTVREDRADKQPINQRVTPTPSRESGSDLTARGIDSAGQSTTKNSGQQQSSQQQSGQKDSSWLDNRLTTIQTPSTVTKNIAGQIARAIIRELPHQPAGRLLVTLQPASLGRVSVEFAKLESQRVNLKITVSSRETLELLKADVGTLKQMLTQLGYDGHQVGIDLGMDERARKMFEDGTKFAASRHGSDHDQNENQKPSPISSTEERDWLIRVDAEGQLDVRL